VTTSLPVTDAAARELGVDEARQALADALRGAAPPPAQAVPLRDAVGRVLAAPLAAPRDVPAQDTAAMDGWAFDGRVLTAVAEGTLSLREAGQVLAGATTTQALGPGECARVMTGAAMPVGADTLLPFEAGRCDGGVVLFDPRAVARGANNRRRGSDIAAGQGALASGTRLRAADIGLAASLGAGTLAVRRRLKVALLSTGDEVVPVGQPLGPGQVHDSNRVALAAVLAGWGFEVADQGHVRDDVPALSAALRQAAASADAVLTSGGVSAGDADHTRAALAQAGDVALWKVAMRPGRPFAFGRLHAEGRSAWLFALPGNPAAAMVSLWMLVREPLLALAGANPRPLPLLPLRLAAPMPGKRVGRTEFARATVDAASATVRPCADQGASSWRGLSQADALIVLAPERGPVAAGEVVAVCLLDSLA
jgi:molybdopterin molybdotransferase